MGVVNAEIMSNSSKDASRKRSKGDASEKGSKKRHRDSTSTNGIERKHKRSKSTISPPQDRPPSQDQIDESHAEPRGAQDIEIDQTSSAVKSKKKKLKKERKPGDTVGGHEDKKDEKDKKREKKNREAQGISDTQSGHRKVVVISSTPGKPPASPQPTGPVSYQYPFYTQTVSQYLPLHPSGANDPIQGYTNQHLKPLLNRYVPGFRGVLLAYRNARVGEGPGKASLTEKSGGDETILLESINEHAVCFGWLTAEIDIFKPSRGAWLEGIVNLQSAGHIGVVCWGKFNASVESERLPRGWRWISQLGDSRDHQKSDEATSQSATPEAEAEAEPMGDHGEVHTTGYWVDQDGSRVTGDVPIRFRIKKYEIPISGDHGYLILEGTMLTEEEEETKMRNEVEAMRHKLRRGVMLRRDKRPLLESSITKFGEDNDKERDGQRADV